MGLPPLSVAVVVVPFGADVVGLPSLYGAVVVVVAIVVVVVFGAVVVVVAFGAGVVGLPFLSVVAMVVALIYGLYTRRQQTDSLVVGVLSCGTCLAYFEGTWRGLF